MTAAVRNRVTDAIQSWRALLGIALVRNSVALVSGTVITQGIVFLCSPFLSRMFGLAEFGALSNYNAWVAILALVSNLRYEYAIIVAEDFEAAAKTVALTIALSVASTCLYGAAAIAIYFGAGAGYLREIHGIILVIPLGVLSVCLSSALTQLSVRLGQFRRVAIATVVQATLTVGFQIGLGLLRQPNALVTGTIIGYAISGVVLAGVLAPIGGLAAIRRAFHAGSLVATARRHINFPRYALPGDAIGVLGKQFVPVFVLAMYSPSAAGLYAFTLRIVRLPLIVVATAISTALRNGALAHMRQEGGLASLYRTTVKLLFLLSFAPFVVMLFFSRQLFGIAFGAQWVDAGRVAQILAPGVLLEFVAFPVAAFFLVTNTQSRVLLVQAIGFCATVIALAIGKYVFADFIAACWLMSAVMVLTNVLSLFLGWRVVIRARAPVNPDARAAPAVIEASL